MNQVLEQSSDGSMRTKTRLREMTSRNTDTARLTSNEELPYPSTLEFEHQL